MRDENHRAAVTAVLKWRAALWMDVGETRAARARLRRCPSLGEALFEPRAIRLVERVGEALGGAFERERAVLLAMVLAEIDTDGKIRFASLLGQTADGKRPAEGERPRLSPIRFRALIEAGRECDWGRFAQALRRAHSIADRAPFNVGSFVADVLFLNDRVLQRWTYEYCKARRPPNRPKPSTKPKSRKKRHDRFSATACVNRLSAVQPQPRRPRPPEERSHRRRHPPTHLQPVAQARGAHLRRLRQDARRPQGRADAKGSATRSSHISSRPTRRPTERGRSPALSPAPSASLRMTSRRIPRASGNSPSSRPTSGAWPLRLPTTRSPALRSPPRKT